VLVLSGNVGVGMKGKVHDRLQLYVEDGIIVLAPSAEEKALVIDRVTFKIELQGMWVSIMLDERVAQMSV
jgi:hypothetical protein